MSRTPSTYRPRSAPTTNRERVLPAWTKEMTELQYQDWLQGRYDPWPSS